MSTVLSSNNGGHAGQVQHVDHGILRRQPLPLGFHRPAPNDGARGDEITHDLMR